MFLSLSLSLSLSRYYCVFIVVFTNEIVVNYFMIEFFSCFRSEGNLEFYAVYFFRFRRRYFVFDVYMKFKFQQAENLIFQW